MSRDWIRLAAAIRDRRSELRLTQLALADRAGMAESTLQSLESDTPKSRLPRVLPQLERALGWAPGSGIAVLQGGGPTLLPNAEAAPAVEGDLAEGMPLRMRQELRRGHVVDSAVVDVPHPGGAGGRFLLVWKTDDEAAAADISPEAVAEWTRVQRALLGTDESSES